MANVREDLELVVRHRLAELAPGWAGTVAVASDRTVLLELTHPYSEGLIIQSRAGLADDAAATAS